MGIAPKSPQSPGFESSLRTGAQRFLERTLLRAHAEGGRTAQDFLRHFKPADIMHGLENAPELRTRILVEAVGIHEKIASRKSTSSAAEDLRIALDERLTEPGAVLALLSPADCVRYLDHAQLWEFMLDGGFWGSERSAGEHDRGVERIAEILEDALAEDLLTLRDVLDGLSPVLIATRLPQDRLQKLVQLALMNAREGKPLSEENVIECVPLRTLLGYVPLEQVWRSVIVERIAKPLGFINGSVLPAAPAATAPLESYVAPKPPPAPVVTEAPSSPVSEAPRSTAPSLRPPKPPVTRSRPHDDAVPPPPSGDPPSDRMAVQDEARTRVIDRLAELNRLPPRHEQLSTSILLSIESMCTDLLQCTTDDARELCIRDSFPNQTQLVTALLALIELLEPGIDVNDPVIRDATADSLIKVLVFEERVRYEQAQAAVRSSGSMTPVPAPRSTRQPAASPSPFKVAPPPLPAKRAR